MSDLQIPTSNPTNWERILRLGARVIDAHPSITAPGQRRRAQLLNAIALTSTLLFVIALAMQNFIAMDFRLLILIPIATFVLGKYKYPRVGVSIFSLSVVSIAYIALYMGYPRSYPIAILSIVPMALVLVNSITSRNTFAVFALIATLGATLAKLYSTTFVLTNDVWRVGGIIFAISLLLLGSTVMRINLEKSYRAIIHAQEQDVETARGALETLTTEHQQTTQSARAEIEARNARLRVIAEISQIVIINTSLPQKELLTKMTEVISEKLGFYHVGIFLLDKNSQYAELYAANSAGGQHMLERRHQLKVGGTGIVGYVSQSGFPRTALSTGADAVFFNNPDLPDTRSEMAIPLKIGSTVIGVLDVQSTLESAFDENDTHTFNVLANQIALAIKQTQTKEQAARAEKEKAKYAGSASGQKGYTYLSDGTITSAKTVSNPLIEKALSSSEPIAMPASSQQPKPTMAIPVRIRDEVIGYIHVESPEAKRRWTEDEITMVQAVAERAALALENARLFEDTERRAEQEQLMTQVTSRIGESTNFERILQVTIEEIGRTLGARRTYIQMESVSSGDSADGQGNNL